jgi:hypothetical protein
MNTKRILAASLVLGLGACANNQQRAASKGTEPPESGEVKVSLEDTPAAVRKTIQNELAGAKLEDIAREQRDGQTVYEADIIRNGQEWEVVIGEDGRIISKAREGSGEREGDEDQHAGREGAWRDHFDVNKADLAPTGGNPWLAIRPGRVLKLSHGNDTLTITILNDSPTVDGVRVGVLEERETKNGQLVEVSRNFLATDRARGDVYYFGEDVDNYKDGKVVSHESAWRSGEHGARFGLMIPGTPRAGDRYYQEIAPKVAMDRVEIVSTDETLKTPAGTFEHCLHLKETTPLEPDVSHKWYAPGVGIVKDDEFELAEKP